MAVNFKSVLEGRVLRFECARAHCVRRAKCKIGPADFPIVERRFRVKFLELDCQHFFCDADLCSWELERRRR
jgi:hypothetical protein